MSNWRLLSAHQLVISTPVPGRVGIPGILPVNPLQAGFGWLPPVWPTPDMWEERTWVPQSVKVMVASIQPPQSLFSGTWQHLLYFSQEHLALKFHSRGHWLCPPGISYHAALMSSGSTKTQGATLLVWGKRELLSCWVEHKRIPHGASLIKCHGYREITLLTRGATNLGINPPNLPTLKIVVLPIKVSSFTKGFLIAQLVKNLPAIQEDPGLIPGLGRSDGEGKGYPLQYFGLENSMDYSPWGRKVSGIMSHFHFHFPLELLKYLLNYLKNYVSQNWSPPASFHILHKSFST